MKIVAWLAATWLVALFVGMVFKSSFHERRDANFDVCFARCELTGATVSTFEQGLGYVRCSCTPKECK